MSDTSAPVGFRAVLCSIGRFSAVLAAYAGQRGLSALGLVALGGVLENFGVALLIPILNIVTATSHGGKFQATINDLLGDLGASTASGRLAVLLALLAVMTMASAAVLFARNIIQAEIQRGFVEAERNGVIRRLAAASWSRIAALRHDRINNLLTTEIQRVGASANFAIQGAVALTTLLIQCALAFILAPKMAMISGTLVLIGAGLLLLALRRTYAIGAEAGQARLALMSMTTGFLGGLKAAIAQNIRGGFADEFEAFQAERRNRQRDLTRSRAYRRFAIAVVPVVTGVLIVWIGFQELSVRPAVLITMVVLFARMTRPLATLYHAAQQFISCVPAFEAIRALELELDADVQPTPNTTPPLGSGPIVLQDVSFVYPGGGGVHAASFVLESGSCLGIIGPTAAGKTTLIDLLVGVLKPQTGQIRAGGQVLEGAYLAAWQNVIAYVGQEPFMFYDTVRRNLVWGGCPADDTTLWHALEVAGAAPLVRGLERGLDTVIGERGMRLSGGERQRIAIARALLRHARLIVLDEATNALDVDSESELLDRLMALDPRPTIVMIAHRTESLVRCDQIAIVERGRPLAMRQSRT